MLPFEDALPFETLPFEEEDRKTDYGLGWKSAFANVGNMADLAVSTLAGSAAALFNDKKEALDIEENMRYRIAERNRWANPENAQLNFKEKLAGAVGTLPLQILGSGLGAADTTDKMLAAGETSGRAVAGGMVDAGLNAAGMMLPGFKEGTMAVRGLTGFGANAAQDYGTKLAIQQIAQNQKTKEIFEPTLEDATVSGIIGAGSAIAIGTQRTPKPTKSGVKLPPPDEVATRLDPLGLDRQMELPFETDISRSPVAEAARRSSPQGDLFEPARDLTPTPEAVRSPIDTESQYSLFDQPEQGRVANPYEAATGDWRIDENGIPIKADLSMEAANMENPLQRNLWGDELDPTRPPVGQGLQGVETGEPQGGRPLTEAIDAMDWAHRRGAINRELKGEVPASGELKSAMMEAEGMKIPKSQRGAIDVDSVKQAIDAFKRGLGDSSSILKAFRGTFSPTEMGEIERVLSKDSTRDRIVLLSPDEFHALALPRNEYGLNNIAPGKRENIRAALKSEDGLSTIPYLRVDASGQIHGHEGRHRMDVFKEQGIDLVPVRLYNQSGNWESTPELRRLIPELAKDWSVDGQRAVAQMAPDKSRYIPKSQRGAIDFEGITEGLKRLIKGKGESEHAKSILQRRAMIPVDPDPTDVVTRALAEGKDGTGFNYLESGATLTAMKRGSALIEGVSRLVQNANKKAEFYIKETVFPVENHMRRLSKKEILGLSDIFKWEMNNHRRLSAEELTASGASMKQLKAYAALRQLFQDTMAIQNKARETLGLEPVTEIEHYMSSRWQGDFRQPVYDKNKHLVWYLAADSRFGLKLQADALLKQFPDLVIDPAKSHVVKSSQSKTDLQSLYSTMLDVLGRDDPSVARIKELVEQQAALEAEGTLAQPKHFERKAGIGGYVGDRPDLSISKLHWKRDPGSEAIEMFQQQIQYAKNAYKWAAMQEAGQKIKSILSNKELLQQQPHNMEYVKEYWKNSLGYGESKIARSIADTVRDLGVAPKVFEDAVGGLKSFFILQKLGVSAGYTLANIIQTANVLPHLAALHGQGYKGNPLIATTVGTMLGFHMATRHYAKAMLDMKNSGIPTKFYEEAFRYAEDNSITTRSIYDEAPINATRGLINQTARFLGKTMTIPETFVRSMAYMTYVQMLKDSKKFKNNIDLFQKAEELTNVSMVDYRANERPMAFSKMGAAGNLANTLQTFPINFYNQWSYFGREAMKGNVGPILVAVALQGSLAGIMGLPYAQDIEKLIEWGKKQLPTKYWAKVKDFDPKLWMLENVGEAAVYGKLSEETNLAMTSRVTAPSVGEMVQAPLGPAGDLIKQGMSVGKAIIDPTEEALSQAAMDVIPTGLQGWLETGPLKDQTSVPRQDGTRLYKKSSDLTSRTGQYARTPEEENIRKYGLRSQKEVFERDLNYKMATKETELRKRSIDLSDSFYSAIRTGNVKKAAEIQTLYTQLNGVEIKDEQIEKQIINEFTTAYERAKTTADKLAAAQGIARMKKIMEDRNANKR